MERSGRFMNPSFAEYHVPVHLDVAEIEVIWNDFQNRTLATEDAVGAASPRRCAEHRFAPKPLKTHPQQRSIQTGRFSRWRRGRWRRGNGRRKKPKKRLDMFNSVIVNYITIGKIEGDHSHLSTRGITLTRK
jgi:hypothetical protein